MSMRQPADLAALARSPHIEGRFSNLRALLGRRFIGDQRRHAMTHSSWRLAGACAVLGILSTLATSAVARDRGDSEHRNKGWHLTEARAKQWFFPGRKHHPRTPFVVRKGTQLYLDGRPFRFNGSNNYYPIFKSQLMVDALFEKAADSNFDVMRVWGALDIGNADGSNSVDGGPKEGVYFQYWNGTEPAINPGSDGLERLDYVIYKAGQEGLKLVIPFVNNWREFGGMDQYVRWRGGQYHDDFYTDPLIRQWYKNWISQVLNRVNTLTGVKYKDDPTIMTWELANEPRCIGSGDYPRSPNCTAQTLVDWARDVSAFVKSIDRNHLVSVGDEGFYCDPQSTDWLENCNEGVDTLAFTRIKDVDVMSLHLYPDHWGKDVNWGTQWIRRHVRDARRLGKAVMLGEFGINDRSIRNQTYQTWTTALLTEGGNGALYWLLSDVQDNGTLYPDYDQFTVYCPSPVCTTISNFGLMMDVGLPLPLKPVADHDTATTPFATPVTLSPLANDIDYWPTAIVPNSLDLDPSTSGRQTTRSVAGGTFTTQSGAKVAFTPAPGFAGNAVISYTVSDTLGRRSNAANIEVTVEPDPNAARVLFSFETGTEGWAQAGWEGSAGTVAQSGDFATDGSSGLRIDAVNGGWFGLTLPAPVDISNKTRLRIDLRTTTSGSSYNIALQVGSGYTWCEGSWGYADANTTALVDIDLTALSCAAQVNDIRGMYLYLNGGSTHYIDAVRAE
jgi:mannan endo-1,4-beta-mannosidase